MPPATHQQSWQGWVLTPDGAWWPPSASGSRLWQCGHCKSTNYVPETRCMTCGLKKSCAQAVRALREDMFIHLQLISIKLPSTMESAEAGEPMTSASATSSAPTRAETLAVIKQIEQASSALTSPTMKDMKTNLEEQLATKRKMLKGMKPLGQRLDGTRAALDRAEKRKEQAATALTFAQKTMEQAEAEEAKLTQATMRAAAAAMVEAASHPSRRLNGKQAPAVPTLEVTNMFCKKHKHSIPALLGIDSTMWGPTAMDQVSTVQFGDSLTSMAQQMVASYGDDDTSSSTSSSPSSSTPAALDQECSVQFGAPVEPRPDLYAALPFGSVTSTGIATLSSTTECDTTARSSTIPTSSWDQYDWPLADPVLLRTDAEQVNTSFSTTPRLPRLAHCRARAKWWESVRRRRADPAHRAPPGYAGDSRRDATAWPHHPGQAVVLPDAPNAVYKVATANIQTLKPWQETRSYACTTLALMNSKVQLLEQQFREVGFACVGLQEGRAAKSSRRDGVYYTTFAAAAEEGGSLGAQLWLDRDLGHQALQWRAVSPRLLFVITVSKHHAVHVWISAHAPTRVATKDERLAFWSELTSVGLELRGRFPQTGESMRGFSEQLNLVAINTFTGSSPTWHSTKGTHHRVDYLLVRQSHQNWVYDVTVHSDLDLTFNGWRDHDAVSAVLRRAASFRLSLRMASLWIPSNASARARKFEATYRAVILKLQRMANGSLRRDRQEVLDSMAIKPSAAEHSDLLLLDVGTAGTAATAAAFRRLGRNKGVGEDNVFAEVLVAGGEPVAFLFSIVNRHVLHTYQWPTQWRGGLLVHMHKQKGDARVCDSSRGILLADHAGKGLASIVKDALAPSINASVFPLFVDLVKAVEKRAWFKLPGGGRVTTSLTSGRQGCKLGSTAFNSAYTPPLDMLKWRLAQEGLTLRLPDAPATFWADVGPPSTEQEDIVDAAFVDDEVVILLSESPAALARAVDALHGIITDAFGAFHLEVNWGKGTLHIVDACKHLGTFMSAQGMLFRSAVHRASSALGVYSPIAFKVFGSSVIDNKCNFVSMRSLVLSRLTFNLHACVLSPRALQKLAGACARVLRRIAGDPRFSTKVAMTYVEVRIKLRMPSLDCPARLRAACGGRRPLPGVAFFSLPYGAFFQSLVSVADGRLITIRSLPFFGATPERPPTAAAGRRRAAIPGPWRDSAGEAVRERREHLRLWPPTRPRNGCGDGENARSDLEHRV
ncbi:unnamed protein product [Prorocentrum cordatum]|uniref:RanBP2-type domain-containing protein n=1 Tax=Prorocentrum cordatum TaxID=2364126 RepID=A0ABN9Y3L5_9DINO|nr:unnamed protein product [Polarella glacialis]